MPQPSEVIERKLGFTPTSDQRKFFLALDRLLSETKGTQVLLLKGYAGTGKTTLVSGLVRTLPLFNKKYLLLAPTGRAAKVLNKYSQRSAFTIHKVMFKQVADEKQLKLRFKRQKNYSKNTVFIVDEASMVGTEPEMGKRSLLEEVFEYVFSKDSNRLIIIGDGAQLPPVGSEYSQSLDLSYLKQKFRKDTEEVVLKEVIRQKHDSGILVNATNLRNELEKEDWNIGLNVKGFSDAYRMTGEKLADGLLYAYGKYGFEDTMIICRSNKAAVQYNRFIRNELFYYDSELEAGDILMIARNNYFFLDPDSAAGFLANGDFVKVNKIISFQELHGLRFADLELQLLDYPEEPFEAKIIIDSLYVESASLPAESTQQLYESVLEDYLDIADKKEQIEAIKTDGFLNALQVKFAYALTCHKSQGGEWKAVFVDQGYLRDDMVSREYLRWLYTAVTRAKEELFFLNFHPKFFVS